MKRRSFLGAMAAAPFAGKAAAEGLARQTGITATGLNSHALNAGMAGAQSMAQANLPGGKPQWEIWREAFKLYPAIRAEQESLMFEQEKIAVLDPDIAVCRSFSFAAKIAYQKQRNVARRMEELQAPPWWTQTDSIFKRLLGLIK